MLVVDLKIVIICIIVFIVQVVFCLVFGCVCVLSFVLFWFLSFPSFPPLL